MMRIALCGSPNIGKSSLFNILTGKREHVGNWAGKTVKCTKEYLKNRTDEIIDVPGTYSLFPTSIDESVAIDNSLNRSHDLFIIVGDINTLSKSLSFTLQILPLCSNAILFLNFEDELNKESHFNKVILEMNLGIPVIIGSIKKNRGIDELKKEIELVRNEKSLQLKNTGYVPSDFSYDEYKKDDNKIIEYLQVCHNRGKTLSSRALKTRTIKRPKIDSLLTHKVYGKFFSLLFLSLLLYLTVIFSNYPSEQLMKLLSNLNLQIYNFLTYLNLNSFAIGLITDGLLGVTFVVLSVMIPPMAIFFPLFSLCEEIGLFPRFTYSCDGLLRKSGAHGKQCLTMCMGLGCNAGGVTQCRIIPDENKRKIAIYTNTFMPCNGRFPTIILISSSFFFGRSIFIKGLYVILFVFIGFLFTLLINKLLTLVMKKEEKSIFILEMTRLRRPNMKVVLIDTFKEKTLKLIGRAIVVSLPIGVLVYLLVNVKVMDHSLLFYMTSLLHHPGKVLGLDGTILSAFILALPANEIVIPMLTLGYQHESSFLLATNFNSIREMLILNGWNSKRALLFLLFSLLHSPCATTLLTVYRETHSLKTTIFSFLIPTIVAITACVILNYSLPNF